MQVWRLARAAHAALDGEGARLHGGRWNSPGRPMVYTAATAALAVLEVRVHLDLPLDLVPADYELFGIELGDIALDRAPRAIDDPRAFGDRWLAAGRAAAIGVPSTIVPEEMNVLINPLHSDAGHIRITSQRPFRLDPRLF